MAYPSGSSPAPSEPPWPPDLCFLSRDPTLLDDSQSGSTRLMHPEVAPLLPLDPQLLPLRPALSPSSVSIVPPSKANPGSSSSPFPASWVSKLQSSAHNLTKMAPPTFTDDGTPVVKAPDSVILKSSVIWKDHLVAQFHGTAPSPSKIFADLNPIWGKHGRIRVRYHSKNVCLIFIPCELSRKWVLDVGLWHSGKCAFSVSPWTPNINLAPVKLEYAPVWILFRGIPQELWSLEGFSTIATGVGFPIQSEFPKITPYSSGAVKLRVTIELARKRTPSVKVVDKMANSVFISTEYLKLPHKCGTCLEYGHSELRCPLRHSFNKSSVAAKDVSPSAALAFAGNADAPPVVAEKSGTPAVSPAVSPAASSNSEIVGRVSQSSVLRNGSPLQKKNLPIKRTTSLPNLKKGFISSQPATGNFEWTPVRQRSSPPREKSIPVRRSPSSPVGHRAPPVAATPVYSYQYDSEEELIRVAQSILRKRIADAEAMLPPFSTEKDKRKIRRQQRQAMLKLCNNLDDSSSQSFFESEVRYSYSGYE